QYATGARAIGAPGWPEFAAWTASIESVRIVLIASRVMSVVRPASVLVAFIIASLMSQAAATPIDAEAAVHRASTFSACCSLVSGARRDGRSASSCSRTDLAALFHPSTRLGTLAGWIGAVASYSF